MLAGLFLIAGLADARAARPVAPFVSEFLVLIGTFTRYQAAAVIATAGIILAAIYILWMYQRTMTGPVADEVEGHARPAAPRDARGRAADRAADRGLGVYPKPVLDVINPAVQATHDAGARHRPEPAHPPMTRRTAQKEATVTGVLAAARRPSARRSIEYGQLVADAGRLGAAVARRAGRGVRPAAAAPRRRSWSLTLRSPGRRVHR